MDKECGAKLAVSRQSETGSITGNFIVCTGSDHCPFESKLNDVPLQAKSLHREQSLSNSTWQSSTNIQHMSTRSCVLGYSQIEKTNDNSWDVQPNKTIRVLTRVLNQVLPR